MLNGNKNNAHSFLVSRFVNKTFTHTETRLYKLPEDSGNNKLLQYVGISEKHI